MQLILLPLLFVDVDFINNIISLKKKYYLKIQLMQLILLSLLFVEVEIVDDDVIRL
jgi:hypothetical protein